jgi:hypothetical protein
MVLVLLHHGLIALLTVLLMGGAIWLIQSFIARRLGLVLEKIDPPKVALGAFGTFAAAYVACGAFILVRFIRNSHFAQELLVVGVVAIMLVLIARCLDRRFVSLLSALVALAIAAVVARVLHVQSNLQDFVGFSAIGSAALLRVPASASFLETLKKAWADFRASLQRPQKAKSNPAHIVQRPEKVPPPPGYHLKPQYPYREPQAQPPTQDIEP